MKNEYMMTYDLYKSWVRELSFQGIRLVFFILWVVLAIISMGLAVFFGIYGLYPNMALMITITLLCVFNAFFRRMLNTKSIYRHLVSTYGKESWKRTISFEEDAIVLKDEDATLPHSYQSIKKIKEKGNEIWIYMANNTILRLYKNAFVGGDWEQCKELIAEKQKAEK